MMIFTPLYFCTAVYLLIHANPIVVSLNANEKACAEMSERKRVFIDIRVGTEESVETICTVYDNADSSNASHVSNNAKICSF